MQALLPRVILRTWLLLPLVAAVATTGCQAFPKTASLTPSWLKRDKSPKVVDSKFKRPVRMVVLWTPSTLNEPGMPPARGFGGRVYFYDEKSETIPVEGQLVVYGYDENSPREGNAQADRKFVFPADKIAQHYSPTDLGASYSVWVPWGKPTDPTTEITLVSVLTTSSGAVVVDEGAKNNLPGAMTERQKEISKSAKPETLLSRAGGQDGTDVAESDGRPKRLQTTTIPLSPRGAERLAASEVPAARNVVPASAQEPLPYEDRPATNRIREGTTGSEGNSTEPTPTKRERRRRPIGGATGTLLGPSTLD